MEPRLWQVHQFIRRIGTMLRVANDDFTREPLPRRWVDLIHYLDEMERREFEEQGRRPH